MNMPLTNNQPAGASRIIVNRDQIINQSTLARQSKVVEEKLGKFGYLLIEGKGDGQERILMNADIMEDLLEQLEYAHTAERLERAKCSKGTDIHDYLKEKNIDIDKVKALSESIEISDDMKIDMSTL